MNESRLVADSVTLAYDDRVVVEDLTLHVPDGRVSVIVGANACGKSTLLRALARLMRPQAGTVVLDGKSIHRRSTKEVARVLGLLPQQPVVPDGVTVVDLVGRGRHPYQGVLGRWSAEDERAVTEALEVTDTLDLADRPVDELSGGQRQRVWLAMALAQGTDLLLLDEPTTYLDIAHQVEVLELCETLRRDRGHTLVAVLHDLNRRSGTTIVMVLHELNLAARYADHLVAMAGGRIVAEGPPPEVITEDCVREVFGLRSQVVTDPVSGTPLVVPIGRHLGPGASERDRESASAS